MHETVTVPISQLLLDTENARLGDEQPSQPATYLALAEQQGRKLLALARDIVENGTDPTTLPAVVATGDRRRRYKVIEGNRRVLAIKALETPNIVSGALSASDQRSLVALSKRFHEAPIEEITCILFDNEEDAYHWVDLRHTGANEGAGLVEWNSDEKNRHEARRGGGKGRSLAGQVTDFIDALDGPPATRSRISTTLDRILKTPDVRKRLGLDKVNGELVSAYPADEVAKGLRKIVNDLRTGEISVVNVYHEKDRLAYIEQFGRAQLPSASKALKHPVPLGELPRTPTKRSGTPRPKPKPKPKPPASRTRVTIAPNTCGINPGPPRINAVFNELLALDADTFPNAGSVLLRVFLELSVDHYLDKMNVMSEAVRRNTKLAKRLKDAADHMHGNGEISDALRKAVVRIADSQHTIAASVTTFNQYVHNEYVLPKPSELRTAWDELQPFLESMWS